MFNFCKICNKIATTADGKLKIAEKTCVMACVDERLSMAQMVAHELCAQAHHGHQEDLVHEAHQGQNQGAE
jgi:hypothetical protein